MVLENPQFKEQDRRGKGQAGRASLERSRDTTFVEMETREVSQEVRGCRGSEFLPSDFGFLCREENGVMSTGGGCSDGERALEN